MITATITSLLILNKKLIRKSGGSGASPGLAIPSVHCGTNPTKSLPRDLFTFVRYYQLCHLLFSTLEILLKK